ncbi:MAG: hypothetical protein ACOY3P_08915 [Planctomycetota bacterium]
MHAEQTDARFQTPRDLAGPHYDEMMRSKETATAYLDAVEWQVCLAAIIVCGNTWQMGPDRALVLACCRIAASDGPESARGVAASVLGHLLSASKAPNASAFLADLVLDSSNSIELRRDAYWALREVQFGVAERDFDTFLKHMISVAKSVMRAYPGRFSEEAARQALTPPDRFPNGFWESAEEIDWDFVSKFVGQAPPVPDKKEASPYPVRQRTA